MLLHPFLFRLEAESGPIFDLLPCRPLNGAQAGWPVWFNRQSLLTNWTTWDKVSADFAFGVRRSSV
jgi:hypothetical protein